ncbi:MAG TPA: protease inhibitor I42 family protein [Methanobacterium sp.]|nr:protease inhibitor I42 family protein [Methanobacterium sp.]
MISLKTASMLIMAIFALSMSSGVFAENKCIQGSDIEEKELNVKLDEKFKIKLESNPSTGYTWIPEFDSDFLKLVKSKYLKPQDSVNPLVGNPGTQKFVFKAIKTGETKITMKYVRPWENCIPSKVIVYNVKITE